MSFKRSFLDLFYLFLSSETPFASIIAYFYLNAGEVAPVRLKYLKVVKFHNTNLKDQLIALYHVDITQRYYKKFREFQVPAMYHQKITRKNPLPGFDGFRTYDCLILFFTFRVKHLVAVHLDWHVIIPAMVTSSAVLTTVEVVQMPFKLNKYIIKSPIRHSKSSETKTKEIKKCCNLLKNNIWNYQNDSNCECFLAKSASFLKSQQFLRKPTDSSDL